MVEGEYSLADRNMLIGALVISSTQIKRNLPAGSDIEVTIEIDESRNVKTTADVPFLDQEFSSVLKLGKPAIEMKNVSKGFEQEKQRLNVVKEKIKNTKDPDAERIINDRVEGEQMIENVTQAIDAAAGDPDAADNALKTLLDFRNALDEAEKHLQWPALVAEAEERVRNTRALAVEYKSADGMRKMDVLEAEVKQAIQNRNDDQLRRSIQAVANLNAELLLARPEFWVGYFQYLITQQRNLMRDQAQVQRLADQGNQAIKNNDLPRLQGTVRQLVSLLPAEAQQNIQSDYVSHLQ